MPKPLKDRPNDWTALESELFNLITRLGNTGLVFSRRIALAQAMMDAFDKFMADNAHYNIEGIRMSKLNKKPLTTVYTGIHHEPEARTTGEVSVLVDGKELSPVRSLNIANHSPTGFMWGYGGSGPAQLSLAILLDYYDNPAMAGAFYQDFKFKVIARFPQDGGWQLTGADIERHIAELQTERMRQ